MRFHSLIALGTVILSVATFANGQAVAPPGGCLVCGDGNVVGDPGGVFIFPAQPQVACGILQNSGLNGQIPLDQCQFLPGLIKEVCQCTPGDLDLAPTVSPAPSAEQLYPPPGGCLICGTGFVTAPDAIFSFPGQPTVPCGALQDAGFEGRIPSEQCPFLLPLIEVCMCDPDANPPPRVPPTSAPIFVANTPSPSLLPVTSAPVVVTDTPSPSLPPTYAPTVGANTPSPVGNGGNKVGMGMGKMGRSSDDGAIEPPTEEPAGGMSGMGMGGMRRTSSTRMMEGGTIRGI